MKALVVAVAAAALLSTTIVARADDDPDYVPGPWHYKSISCVDTTITSVGPRLEGSDFKSTGADVQYATTLGIRPLFSNGTAEVVHYQDEPGNAVMAAEHKGDRVQVCFLGGPPPTTYCNPDQDGRGRKYRVWDYKQKKQYWGINSEHDCGGA